jgi:hypothetical protein
MTNKRTASNILFGKPEGKRTLRRPRRRWEDNIRLYFREYVGEVWTGCIRLWVDTIGGPL